MASKLATALRRGAAFRRVEASRLRIEEFFGVELPAQPNKIKDKSLEDTKRLEATADLIENIERVMTRPESFSVFTESQAAEILGISRKTLERHRAEGKVNPQPFGKGWCYTAAMLSEWKEKYGASVAEKQARLA